MNRLVLNLKHVASNNGNDTALVTEAAFATNPFLGNIGAPIHLGSREIYFEDDYECSEMEMAEASLEGP